jgi:hypothetical protein
VREVEVVVEEVVGQGMVPDQGMDLALVLGMAKQADLLVGHTLVEAVGVEVVEGGKMEDQDTVQV